MKASTERRNTAKRRTNSLALYCSNRLLKSMHTITSRILFYRL